MLVEHGDCIEVMKQMRADSVDAVVTDPPYHFASIVKRYGPPGAAPTKHVLYERATRGFMGRTWDGGDIAFRPETWAEVMRVMKPGAHLVAFGAPKNYHRLACAIEDAGLEIRDSLMWVFGTGFPKSLNVQQAINKAAAGFPQGGADPRSPNHGKFKSGSSEENPAGRGFGAGAAGFMEEMGEGRGDDVGPWEGWGTALKPAFEPIVLARKPIEGTVAENVLRYGVGALNIDATRIHADDAKGRAYTVARTMPGAGQDKTGERKQQGVVYEGKTKDGRWPANLIHDGSDEVVGLFPADKGRNTYGAFKGDVDEEGSTFRGDSGSAARFFYCAKATKAERHGSKHPTVKPIALMRWLVRLIVPPGGVVLDPFAGTGPTGEAALLEDRDYILIERELEYVHDIIARLSPIVGATDE